MNIAELITADRVLLDVNADCSKAVFRCVADVLEPHVPISARDICSALQDRERLGTTALGNGISIPHARLKDIEKPTAFFMRLARPIAMDAMDDKPVDLFFIVLVPEEADNDHLRILSRIARILRSMENQIAIRGSENTQEILSILTSEDE